LLEALIRNGIAAIATREPGGAPGAEAIRQLLVEGDPERWDGISEALLMVAARRAHLTETVWPALEKGQWVVCDRFADSTLAYQGYGKGVPLEILKSLHLAIAGEFAPDLTLILDLPVDQGLARAHSRAGAETRFERMDRGFHERMRQGFLDIAANEPRRCVLIDATGAVPLIHAKIMGAIAERLEVTLG